MKNKENWLFAIIFLVLVISTGRYIKAGEPYYFETDISDEIIVLSDTHEILQNIIVDKNARWTGGTWSLQFAPVLATGGGVRTIFTDTESDGSAELSAGHQ